MPPHREQIEQLIRLLQAHNLAAPLNVRRHSHFRPLPPCGVTAVCGDCASPWRICKKMVAIEGEFSNDRNAR
jgi:hypothetical protein